MRRIAKGAAVLGGIVAVLALGWSARGILARLAPIEHEGVVERIGQFHKGGLARGEQDTHQIRQFALIFEDGFLCEGSDTSFAAIREGDRIRIRAYHDVRGAPILDPEWWECDEAQLVELVK